MGISSDQVSWVISQFDKEGYLISEPTLHGETSPKVSNQIRRILRSHKVEFVEVHYENGSSRVYQEYKDDAGSRPNSEILD